jgi:hypothetical protein
LWFIILSLIIAPVMGVLREDVVGSAAWAAIDLQKQSAPHQLHVVQPLRLRSGAAADADVGPNAVVDGNGEGSEIERPTIDAQARAEQAVRQPREPGEQMQRKLGSVASQQVPLGPAHAKVFAIEKRKRSAERAGLDMTEVSGAFDGGGEFLRRSERVDVAAAPGQPAVQPIAEGGGVGDGDVEGPGGFQYPSDFGERAVKIVKVFQAVIGDDGVEGAVGEGKARGVGLREIFCGAGGVIEISADGDEWSEAGGETSGARAEVEDALAGPEVLQNFVHGTFLAGMGPLEKP